MIPWYVILKKLPPDIPLRWRGGGGHSRPPGRNGQLRDKSPPKLTTALILFEGTTLSHEGGLFFYLHVNILKYGFFSLLVNSLLWMWTQTNRSSHFIQTLPSSFVSLHKLLSRHHLKTYTARAMVDQILNWYAWNCRFCWVVLFHKNMSKVINRWLKVIFISIVECFLPI